MEIEKISTEDIKDARAKWKEYKEACKENPKDKYLQQMKAVYNQVKAGRKLIDITVILERAGRNEKGEPKVAICPADANTCYLQYATSGELTFSRRPMRFWENATKEDVVLQGFPTINQRAVLKTLVPKIPPSLRPKAHLKNYYILFDVEEWKMEPPKDPYLLRRINGTLFVVLAAWDLTELERAVLKGRAW